MKWKILIILILCMSFIPLVSALTLVSTCNNLTTFGETYQLSDNINETTLITCFNIWNNSITLDGAGFWLKSQTANSNIAINPQGYSNVIIKNFAGFNGGTNEVDSTWATIIRYNASTFNLTIYNNTFGPQLMYASGTNIYIHQSSTSGPTGANISGNRFISTVSNWLGAGVSNFISLNRGNSGVDKEYIGNNYFFNTSTKNGATPLILSASSTTNYHDGMTVDGNVFNDSQNNQIYYFGRLYNSTIKNDVLISNVYPNVYTSTWICGNISYYNIRVYNNSNDTSQIFNCITEASNNYFYNISATNGGIKIGTANALASNNTVVNSTMGIYSSANCTLFNNFYYGNKLDIKFDVVTVVQTINITNDVIDRTGDLTNASNITIIDVIEAKTGFALNYSDSPTSMPTDGVHNLTATNTGLINILQLNGSNLTSLDNIKFYYPENTNETGYELWRYNYSDWSLLNATVDTTNNYLEYSAYAFDNSSVGILVNLSKLGPAPPSDTCTAPASGDWLVNWRDNCSVTSNTVLGSSGNLIMNNTNENGTFTIKANLTCHNIYMIPFLGVRFIIDNNGGRLIRI